jgi:hypothetical protein
MKSSLWIVGVLFAAAYVAAACSDNAPSRPPVATTGGSNPTGGSGSTSPGTSSDGGSSGSDAGTTVLPEGGTCNPNNCPTSCCTTLGVCVMQQTNSSCGQTGNTCQACTGGTTCVDGTCEL